MSRTWLLGVAAALVLLTGLSWGAQQRQPIEASTEFYLFGRAGQLAEYPDRVPPNQRLPLFLAINNIEGRDLQYRVRGGFNTERRDLQTASVSKGQEWKAPLEVSAPSEPGKHTLTLDLYRPSDTQPYRQLTLTVTVQ